MNFYQNKIWKSISKDIFNKDIFDINLFGKKYWGIKKTHKKFGFTLNWFQVLGITIPENISEKDMKNELSKIKKQFGQLNNIFFQLGFINKLDKPFFENRKNINNSLKKEYEIYPSIKENMPLATVIVDIQKSDEEIFSNFTKSAKRNINRGIKNGLYFEIAKNQDIEDFYKLWLETANLKGFSIYSKKEYTKLIDFLQNTGCGNLYLVKKEGKIISGSIEINEKEKSYYLYGATNREYTKTGGHYYLKYEMFKYLRANKGIKKVDLLGVAPEGYENHHLKGVSQFKHTLGGEHIEYYGNYDIPLNKNLYNLLKLFKK